jgi:hypothetical protein
MRTKCRNKKNNKIKRRSLKRRSKKGGTNIYNLNLEWHEDAVDGRIYDILETDSVPYPYEFRGKAVAVVFQPRCGSKPVVSYRVIDGPVILKTHNGVYEGNFLDGKKNGYGTYKFLDGSVYEGNWVDNVMSGEGTMTYPDGTVYEGNWEDNVSHGKGKLTQPSQGNEYTLSYNGDFVKNKKSGYGGMVYSDGGVYNGEWDNDQMHGTGTFRYKNGDIYEGDWDMGFKHGMGNFKYNSGELKEYTGSFVDGTMEGKGIMKFRNKTQYNGDWKNGKMTGHGKLYDESGSLIHEGEFNDGVPVHHKKRKLLFE